MGIKEDDYNRCWLIIEDVGNVPVSYWNAMPLPDHIKLALETISKYAWRDVSAQQAFCDAHQHFGEIDN
jgi:hypothetical protein